MSHKISGRGGSDSKNRNEHRVPPRRSDPGISLLEFESIMSFPRCRLTFSISYTGYVSLGSVPLI